MDVSTTTLLSIASQLHASTTTILRLCSRRVFLTWLDIFFCEVNVTYTSRDLCLLTRRLWNLYQKTRPQPTNHTLTQYHVLEPVVKLTVKLSGITRQNEPGRQPRHEQHRRKHTSSAERQTTHQRTLRPRRRVLRHRRASFRVGVSVIDESKWRHYRTTAVGTWLLSRGRREQIEWHRRRESVWWRVTGASRSTFSRRDGAWPTTDRTVVFNKATARHWLRGDVVEQTRLSQRRCWPLVYCELFKQTNELLITQLVISASVVFLNTLQILRKLKYSDRTYTKHLEKLKNNVAK